MCFKLLKELNSEVREQRFVGARARTEGIVDMAKPSNIMGFVYFEMNQSGDSYNHKNFNLVMLNFDDWSKNMICIEPPSKSLEHLYH